MSSLTILTLLASVLPGQVARDVEPGLRPYVVRIWFDDAGWAYSTAARRAALRRELAGLCDRHFAAGWQVTFEPRPNDVTPGSLPSPEALGPRLEGADKLFWLEVGIPLTPAGTPRRTAASRVEARVREYDSAFEEWGPPAKAALTDDLRLGQALFDLLVGRFRPIVQTPGGSEEGEVTAQLWGRGLMPADSPYADVPVGQPFRLIRRAVRRSGEVVTRPIPWSYITYRAPDPLEPGGLVGNVVSALRNPLSTRTRGRQAILGLACVGDTGSTTRVVFLRSVDERPAVGITVLARTPGTDVPRPIGTTDDDGVVLVRPLGDGPGDAASADARHLTIMVRVGEGVVASFPLVPGAPNELKVRVRVDPLTLRIHGRILALQEKVVDTIAQRRVLEFRMRARQKDGDADEVREIATRLNSLPGRNEFTMELERIRSEAAADLKERTDDPDVALGRSIGRLFAQTERLLEDYLGNPTEVRVTTETVTEE